jgi:hypothetical protein
LQKLAEVIELAISGLVKVKIGRLAVSEPSKKLAD